LLSLAKKAFEWSEKSIYCVNLRLIIDIHLLTMMAGVCAIKTK